VYLEASTVVVLLCAAVVVAASTRTAYAVFAGVAEPKTPALLTASGTILHIILAVILGKQFGIVGVAWSVFLSGFIVDGLAMTLIMASRYHINIGEYLKLLARAHALPVICAGAVGLYLDRGPLWDFVRSHARVVGVLGVIVAGLIMLAVYMPIYAFTGLSQRERIGAIGRVRGFLRRTG
jgi:O-antigen/teichoic acid export membrane protein